MDKSDHIALTLSTSASLAGGVGGAEDGAVSTKGFFTRKSLRRSWNQLPRCQRNLIILGISALCLTVLLLIPGDQLITNNEKSFDSKSIENGGEANYLLFNHKNVPSGLRRNLGERDALLAETGGSSEAVVEDNKLPATEINLLENVARLPETQKTKQTDDQPMFEESEKRPSAQEDNNIEAPAAAVAPLSADDTASNDIDQRSTIEAAMREPERLLGISIDEYINHLQSSGDAQKHHFHGATNERQSVVVEAFKHSWAGYKKYAWGHDNLKPISQTSHEWFGLGLTIIDSLDTMYIMGLEEEFSEAREWVENSLRFNTSRDVNLFEVTIRVLGGLLSTYHLSGDKMFLRKSVELGNRLLPSFLSPSGIPYSDVNLGARSAHSPKWSPDSSTSEVTTIQLEFRDLSRSINVPIYEKVVNVVNEKVHALEKNNGLVPIFINANTGTFRNYATISLGARGDSYYEYLLKQWLQTGRKNDDFLILDYMHAIDGVLTQLMRRTPKENHVYVGELINGKDFKPKMDHLTCYLPGTLLLGHHNGMPDSHLLLAKDLLDTCYQTYIKQQTQLAPEISYFAVNENDEQDIYVKPNDAHNLLRPEFIESLYYFYSLTGNRTYQDMGWTIFQAFEKHTKVAAGYTSIGNVKNIFNTRLRDMMESFWLSETLKYFYLLFSDNRNEIDLEKWVFNSEAHPLPIRQY